MEQILKFVKIKKIAQMGQKNLRLPNKSYKIKTNVPFG